MNFIEHICGTLDRKIRKKNRHSFSKAETWQEIPQGDIANLSIASIEEFLHYKKSKEDVKLY